MTNDDKVRLIAEEGVMNWRCSDCINLDNPTGMSVSPCYQCKWMDDRPDNYHAKPKPRKRCETCKYSAIDPLDASSICMSKSDKVCKVGHRAAWCKQSPPKKGA